MASNSSWRDRPTNYRGTRADWNKLVSSHGVDKANSIAQNQAKAAGPLFSRKAPPRRTPEQRKALVAEANKAMLGFEKRQAAGLEPGPYAPGEVSRPFSKSNPDTRGMKIGDEMPNDPRRSEDARKAVRLSPANEKMMKEYRASQNTIANSTPQASSVATHSDARGRDHATSVSGDGSGINGMVAHGSAPSVGGEAYRQQQRQLRDQQPINGMVAHGSSPSVGGEAYRQKQRSAPIDGAGGRWVTINGAHVFLKD